MKFRTDFVTNSSSSGFVAFTLTMKDGSKYSGHDDGGMIFPDVKALNENFTEFSDFDTLDFKEGSPIGKYSSLEDILSLEMDDYEVFYGEEYEEAIEFADEDEIDEDAGEVTAFQGKNTFHYTDGLWVEEE